MAITTRHQSRTPAPPLPHLPSSALPTPTHPLVHPTPSTLAHPPHGQAHEQDWEVAEALAGLGGHPALARGGNDTAETRQTPDRPAHTLARPPHSRQGIVGPFTLNRHQNAVEDDNARPEGPVVGEDSHHGSDGDGDSDDGRSYASSDVSRSPSLPAPLVLSPTVKMESSPGPPPPFAMPSLIVAPPTTTTQSATSNGHGPGLHHRPPSAASTPQAPFTLGNLSLSLAKLPPLPPLSDAAPAPPVAIAGPSVSVARPAANSPYHPFSSAAPVSSGSVGAAGGTAFLNPAHNAALFDFSLLPAQSGPRMVPVANTDAQAVAGPSGAAYGDEDDAMPPPAADGDDDGGGEDDESFPAPNGHADGYGAGEAEGEGEGAIPSGETSADEIVLVAQPGSSSSTSRARALSASVSAVTEEDDASPAPTPPPPSRRPTALPVPLEGKRSARIRKPSTAAREGQESEAAAIRAKNDRRALALGLSGVASSNPASSSSGGAGSLSAALGAGQSGRASPGMGKKRERTFAVEVDRGGTARRIPIALAGLGVWKGGKGMNKGIKKQKQAREEARAALEGVSLPPLPPLPASAAGEAREGPVASTSAAAQQPPVADDDTLEANLLLSLAGVGRRPPPPATAPAPFPFPTPPHPFAGFGLGAQAQAQPPPVQAQARPEYADDDVPSLETAPGPSNGARARPQRARWTGGYADRAGKASLSAGGAASVSPSGEGSDAELDDESDFDADSDDGDGDFVESGRARGKRQREGREGDGGRKKRRKAGIGRKEKRRREEGEGSGSGSGSGEGSGKGKEKERRGESAPTPPSHPGYLLQTTRCTSRNKSTPLGRVLAEAPNCHECISRVTGYSCLFRHLRSFALDPLSETGDAVPEGLFLPSLEADDVPLFPSSFDRPFTPREASALKTAAAHHLVPTLRAELAHAQREGAARIRRELGLTSTCDACAHAILCGSWMCRACGRELCFECAGVVDALEVVAAGTEGGARRAPDFAGTGEAESTATATPVLNYPPPTPELLHTAQTLPPNTHWKLTHCRKTRTSSSPHGPDLLVPLTRLSVAELERLVGEMERWAQGHELPRVVRDAEVREEGGEWAEWLGRHEEDVEALSGGAERSHPVLRVPGQLVPPRMDEEVVKREWEAIKAAEGDAKGKGKARAADQDAVETGDELATFYPSPTSPPSAAPAASSSTGGALPSFRSLTPPPASSLPSSASHPTHPSHALFSSLWALGVPFVVDLAPDPPSRLPGLPWTPEYFVERYGGERVTVGSNRPEVAPAMVQAEKQPQLQAGDGDDAPPAPAPPAFGDDLAPPDPSTSPSTSKPRPAPAATAVVPAAPTSEGRRTSVAEFFATFGLPRGGSTTVSFEEEGEDGERRRVERAVRREEWVSEKIKDWPPAHDFKNQYPELWEDFMAVLPAGSITRRDGVLNISSHTPGNANPPDLGPKGYFSHISDDHEGGMGSTKLHTVNLLLWASEGPDGSPGVAVWDLYRAEDADKIREFLYELVVKRDPHRYKDVEDVKRKMDDPIHTQIFFLDSTLRQQLWDEKGVKSWRIHQKVGQVVFIPAGCAHQVCNFSDCIKVASDFVSVENVGRCWKVSDEFRTQTKDRNLWRSDVLQLKSMLLWAWYSAERFDRAIPDEVQAGPEAAPGPNMNGTALVDDEEEQKPLLPLPEEQADAAAEEEGSRMDVDVDGAAAV
ncbi:hypothetical protein JCM10207_006176 [Rhodosporidiobolus poonsookiae]